MAWKQILVQLEKLHVEKISDWLSENLAQAVTFEDAKNKPILEPAPGETPLWDRVIVTALFDDSDPVEKITQQLHQTFADEILTSKIVDLQDQQWERAWMKDFKAMKFGQRLWICPSWEEVPEPEAVNIILDPGLAFGSGTHETTALCLHWLDSLTLANKHVLDYGCGSGILAIAAAKLGAKHVIGTDNDPQAIIASKQNSLRNQIDPLQFELILVSADKPPALPAVDVLVANILAEPLRQLAEELAKCVKTGGKMALSGILNDQADEIVQIYTEWFYLNPVKQLGNWSLVSGVRR